MNLILTGQIIKDAQKRQDTSASDTDTGQDSSSAETQSAKGGDGVWDSLKKTYKDNPWLGTATGAVLGSMFLPRMMNSAFGNGRRRFGLGTSLAGAGLGGLLWNAWRGEGPMHDLYTRLAKRVGWDGDDSQENEKSPGRSAGGPPPASGPESMRYMNFVGKLPEEQRRRFQNLPREKRPQLMRTPGALEAYRMLKMPGASAHTGASPRMKIFNQWRDSLNPSQRRQLSQLPATQVGRVLSQPRESLRSALQNFARSQLGDTPRSMAGQVGAQRTLDTAAQL